MSGADRGSTTLGPDAFSGIRATAFALAREAGGPRLNSDALRGEVGARTSTGMNSRPQVIGNQQWQFGDKGALKLRCNWQQGGADRCDDLRRFWQFMR